MRLVIEIELGNAAMETPDEVAAAVNESLHPLDGDGGALFSRGDTGRIRDGNGNSVGYWAVA